MGLDLRIAVNLSGRQFCDALADRVKAVLDESGFPPELLELELTESFLVTDTEKAVRILCSLRELGVRVALDDFGTGWSSLNYLKNFPVDTLKIDRSFIGSTVGEFDTRIVRAIIAIAREFNLTTLAEGVETDAQLAKLHELGCDSWQGYLLSGAIPANDLTDFCQLTDMASDRFSPQQRSS
jgi:EAL domain-containing protein (putative c-di-GMP-specific phosphodiesterase class I)